MDNEVRELLKKNLKLAEENNRLLKSIRRSARIGTFLKILWWAIIIGLPVYLYFAVVEPYLVSLNEAYEGVKTNVETLGQIPEPLQSLLERLPGRD